MLPISSKSKLFLFGFRCQNGNITGTSFADENRLAMTNRTVQQSGSVAAENETTTMMTMTTKMMKTLSPTCQVLISETAAL